MVNTSGTGKNANIDGREGIKKVKPLYKKATKDSQIKMSCKKGEKPKKPKKATRTHYWVIQWLVLQHV